MQPYERDLYGRLDVPIPQDNNCVHEFGRWENTQFKGVYTWMCKKCSQTFVFEKDFE